MNQCYISPFPWRNTFPGPNEINTNKIMSLGLQDLLSSLEPFLVCLHLVAKLALPNIYPPPHQFHSYSTSWRKSRSSGMMRSHNLCSITCIAYPYLFLYSASASENELLFYSWSRPAFLPLHLTLSPSPSSGILFHYPFSWAHSSLLCSNSFQPETYPALNLSPALLTV